MAVKAKIRTWAVGAALALVTALLYAPALGYGFVNYDDPVYVNSNVHVNQGWSWSGLVWCFQAGYASNWHPLTWLSHATDCQFFGSNLGGHHATSVLLHIADAILLFLVARKLTGAFWRSAMVAALFAWHPLHVESVAWVSERKDVLSALFWMLTIWAYLRYVGGTGDPPVLPGDSPGSSPGGAVGKLPTATGGSPLPPMGYYILALVFFALGLMAKPMLVTLPFVLLLLDWWPLGRWKEDWRLCVEKIPFFILSALSCVLTVIAQRRGGAVAALEEIPFSERMINAVVAYGAYVGKLFWPARLAAIYPIQHHWPLGEVIGAVLFLMAVSAAAIRLRKSRPYVLVGWLWYLGTLVPVIGLVQVGGQAMADRYTYIPSIGIFIIVCWGVCDLCAGWGKGRDTLPRVRGSGGDSEGRAGTPCAPQGERRAAECAPYQTTVVAGLAVAALAVCVVLTSRQVTYWKDGGTLFSHAIAVTKDNYMAHAAYGSFLLNHQELDQARTECEKSLEIFPGYVEARYYLGYALWLQHDLPASALQLRAALEGEPNKLEARELLGKVLMAEEQPQEAARQFAAALSADPGSAEMQCWMGLALATQHKTREAVPHFEAALRVAPDFAEALNDLARILAVDADPGLRNGARAVELATQACQLTQGRQPLMLGTLASAYAETGRFEEAVATAQNAHDWAVAQGNGALAARIQQQLELYRSHQAYHEK